MKIAIYVLYQRPEFEKAACFLTHVAPSLAPDINLYLLINDDDCPAIRAQANALSPYIKVITAYKNLGVAGGRNHLIRLAISEGAEFLIACDTDILFEANYFRRICGAYFKLREQDSNLGLVQPLLFNGPDVLKCFEVFDKVESWGDLKLRLKDDKSLLQHFWPRIRCILGEDAGMRALMHTGVSNIWRAHFGPPIGDGQGYPDKDPSFIDLFGTRNPRLISDLEKLRNILTKSDPVRIGSTDGGVSAFHRDLFERCGGYDEIFNPFGYEDSEFGFRTQSAGYHHYLIPSCAGIHDLFISGQNRNVMYAARIGLLRGVEVGGQWVTPLQRGFLMRQSLLFGANTIVKMFDKEVNNAPAQQEQLKKLFPSALASYGFEFFRGLVHSASLGKAADLTSLARLMADETGEITDFAFPLDETVSFVARRVVKRGKLPLSPNERFGIHAFDCHVIENTSSGALSSRHFDLSVRVERDVSRCDYKMKIDLFSDDILHKLEIGFTIDMENAAKRGILQVNSFNVYSKTYDYGTFSVEDLYPSPDIFKSQRWLPLLEEELNTIAEVNPAFNLNSAIKGLISYFHQGKRANAEFISSGALGPVPSLEATNNSKKSSKRVLIFTDSRGQHKPAGTTHDVFAERLAKDPRLDVDMFLCPMKWTTTLDFLEQFPPERLAQYDHVILYTGIVEWSPRPAMSARADLYDNQSPANTENLSLNTRDYSRKIVNNKKTIFDRVFGAEAMAAHLAAPFDTVYEGQQTLNMYGLEMARSHLLPILAAIPNLIFVTANRFVPGWEGDFKRGRPANIRIAEQYSDLFATELGRAGIPVVDLREWSQEEVKTYTCDNMHLTERGSDYIYKSLAKIMNIDPIMETRTVSFEIPDYEFTGFGPIERVVGSKRAAVMASAKCEDATLATLIIGVRHNPTKPERLDNLKFLLRWIDYYYGDLFDVLLMEQDAEPRLSLADLDAKPYVRHAFAFNPEDYNRGWGYNVAVRHHSADAKVVALMDTDVLTGPSFLRDVMDCHAKIDVASPYLNIYYTDAQEALQVQSTMKLAHLTNEAHIKNPVTVAGGIVIWNRASYMGIKGFEQYLGYSCEDRAMDVAIFNHIEKSRIRVSPQTYVHLFHETDTAARSRFKEIYAHLTENYGCAYDKSLTPFEFIHKNCQHVDRTQTTALMVARNRDFGDPELYSRGDALAINGVRLATPPMARMGGVTFPPEFRGLKDYAQREIYANTPQPDSAELAQFYNRFQGQRCFIIGNGPSLNRHDLSLLENEYSFGVNSFYYKTRESGFSPTFYVVEDSSVMKENIDEIRAYEAPFKFFPTIYRKLHPKDPNTFFFEMNRGFYEKTSPNYAVPRFSTDATKVLYCGQSVTYINLQLAYFMGFTEVFLIGMDFDYVIPDSHKRTGDVLLSDTDDPNHFHKDYFGAGKTWKDPKLDRVLMNYRMADLAYSAVGRKIYNATIGGKLEIFDRVDYEGLLRDPDTGSKRTTQIEPPITAFGSLLRQQGKEDLSASVTPSARREVQNSSDLDGVGALQEAQRRICNGSGLASALLRLTGELLLDPVSALARLEEPSVAQEVAGALAAMAEDDALAVHFRRVEAFARSRAALQNVP